MRAYLFQIHLELYLTITLAGCLRSPRLLSQVVAHPQKLKQDYLPYKGFLDWSLMLLEGGRHWEAQKVVNLLSAILSHQDTERLVQTVISVFYDDDGDSALTVKVAIMNQSVTTNLDNPQPDLTSQKDWEYLEDMHNMTVGYLNRIFGGSTDKSRHFDD